MGIVLDPRLRCCMGEGSIQSRRAQDLGMASEICCQCAVRPQVHILSSRKPWKRLKSARPMLARGWPRDTSRSSRNATQRGWSWWTKSFCPRERSNPEVYHGGALDPNLAPPVRTVTPHGAKLTFRFRRRQSGRPHCESESGHTALSTSHDTRLG